MNKIDALIAQHCKNGVVYKPLGEVVRIRHGKDYKNLQSGNIPVYGSGGVMTYVNKYSYNKPTVLIPRKGSITNLFYLETPFWNVDTIYYTEIDEMQLSPKFLYYCMKTVDILSLDTGSGRPSLTMEILNKIKIPLPPLPIQHEIVKILDAFTQLEAELEAQLEAELVLRKKQYEYYRNKLLNFDKNVTGGVTWKMLSELGEFVRGNGLPKSDFTECGIPAIHYGQIYKYYGLSTNSTISFVSPETANKLKKVNTGDVVITNTSENFEDVGKAVVYLGIQQAVTGGHATIFKPSKKILGKYFAYFTQTAEFTYEKRKYSKGTKVIDISANDMMKIKIPIPYADDLKKSLEEQNRIVTILDKFDSLVNDISHGLPAEIKDRRNQYEYYRNLLLNFPKAQEAAA